MKLEVFEKKINKLDDVNITIRDYEEFKNIVDTIIAEERQEKYDRIAETLFKLLSMTNHKFVTDEIIDILTELSKMIAISNSKSDKGSYAFFKFLYSLQLLEQSTTYIEGDLIERYLLFGDIIEQVGWVFSLKKDDVIIFPIHKLLSKLATDFECNNDSLVHLAIALQLFSMANNWVKLETTDMTKEIITEIAQKYNIRFLEYLLDDGKIHLKNNDNYLENGTLIFDYKEHILIRNVSELYFGTNSQCKHEIDDQGHPIAYYVEFKKPENATLTSFIDIMNRDNQFNLKLQVLDKIMEEKNYNILYENLLYVNNQTSEFVGFLNPFGENDIKIIFENDKTNNDITGFLSILKRRIKNIRGSILYKNKVDILTLDFILTFFEYIPINNVKINLCSINNANHDDFFQNLIIRDCFSQIKKVSPNKYFELIIQYSEYVSRYLSKITLATEMNEDLVLILPYNIYFEFTSIEDFYGFEKERIWGEEASKNIEWRSVEYVQNPMPTIIDSNTKKELKVIDLYDNELDCNRLSKKFECFIDNAKFVAYYDEELYLQYKGVQNIINWNKDSTILYDNFKYIDEQSFENVSKMIRLNKLEKVNYDIFSSNVENPMISYYKLIWHFSFLHWKMEDVKSFFDLILNKHYTKSLLEYNSCYNILEYIEKLIITEDVLVIAKENDHNQGTLWMLFNEYSIKYGNKSRLIEMFQKESISKRCNEKTIKKIVFVTDMIMTGYASGEAIVFYLTGNKKSLKKEFIDVSSDIIKIIKKDKNFPIELMAIWGYKSSVDKIKGMIEYSNFSVNIINEIPKSFKCDSIIIDMVNKLYNHKANEGIYCIFRYNNMPARAVFPDYVMNTSIMGGIFNRKKEFC